MNLFLLKLIMTPLIIGLASLAGRRWGAAVSGWLVGLPLTSGPVIFFLALSHDRAFVFDAVSGVLSGGFPLIAYSLVYGWTARKFNWPVSLVSSVIVFLGMTALLKDVAISFIPLFLSVITVILLGLWLMPKEKNVRSTISPDKWDIPARIVIGTSFILLITGSAPFLGPRLTGLLATIPLYVSILTVFAHRHQGRAGAVSVLRGLVYGLFAFAGFFLVLGLLIGKTSLAACFGIAIVVALIVQGCTLLILRGLHQTVS